MAVLLRQYLLIDDDFDDQEIFRIALNTADPEADCVFANGGEHALKILTNKSFHPLVIFIDINMPRMNGVECLKAIKNLKRFAETPVYMISTAGSPAIIEECKQNGAIDYIIKSPSLSLLEQRLSDVLATVSPMQIPLNGKK